MWRAFGEVMSSGVGIALSPAGIGLSVVLLLSAGGMIKAAAFGVGIGVAVAALVSVAYFTASVYDVDSEQRVSDGVDLLQVLFGVFLVALAWRAWRHRPPPGVELEEPALFAKVGQWGPTAAFFGGVATTIINVKAPPLALSAGGQLAQHTVDGSAAVGAVILFSMVSTGAAFAPLTAAIVVGPECRQAMLESMRRWLVTNMTTIVIVLFTVLGANTIGHGLSG